MSLKRIKIYDMLINKYLFERKLDEFDQSTYSKYDESGLDLSIDEMVGA